jgi:glycosyltransferase involved in cell wall biosynthesis
MDNLKPQISVLLPIKNSVKTLEECLESLAAQKFKNFEIVAVDHNSSDRSLELLAARQKTESRLKIFKFPFGNLIDVLNFGLEKCQAPKVARMDADDICFENRFEKQFKFMNQNPDLTLCGARVKMISADKIGQGWRDYESWINKFSNREDILSELFVECPLSHPTWMFNRLEVKVAGGYRDMEGPEDYELLLRLVAEGKKISICPEKLLYWREHPDRHSRLHKRYHHKAFFKIKALYLEKLFLKGRLAVIWGLGGRARWLAQFLKREKIKISKVVGHKNKRPRYFMAGAPVCSPAELELSCEDGLIFCVATPGAKKEFVDWARFRNLKENLDYVLAS